MKKIQGIVHGGMMVVMFANSVPALAQQAVQIQDGKDITLGAKSDAACANAASTCTVNSVAKALLSGVLAPIPTQAATVTIGGAGAFVNVGGTPTILEVCGSYTTLSVTVATTLQIIGTASGVIRICDFDISNQTSAATSTLTFIIGTGTNCATNSSQLGQAWYVTAAWAKAAMNPYYRGVNSSAVASSALCVKSTGTTTVDIGVYYDRI